jgi:hypothetical protein
MGSGGLDPDRRGLRAGLEGGASARESNRRVTPESPACFPVVLRQSTDLADVVDDGGRAVELLCPRADGAGVPVDVPDVCFCAGLAAVRMTTSSATRASSRVSDRPRKPAPPAMTTPAKSESANDPCSQAYRARTAAGGISLSFQRKPHVVAHGAGVSRRFISNRESGATPAPTRERRWFGVNPLRSAIRHARQRIFRAWTRRSTLRCSSQPSLFPRRQSRRRGRDGGGDGRAHRGADGGGQRAGQPARPGAGRLGKVRSRAGHDAVRQRRPRRPPQGRDGPRRRPAVIIKGGGCGRGRMLELRACKSRRSVRGGWTLRGARSSRTENSRTR